MVARRRRRARIVVPVLSAIALVALVASGCGADAGDPAPETIDAASSPDLVRLVDVAHEVGLDFTHGAFRWAPSGDPVAMMGSGVCWLDIDGDGFLDLFAVNSYAEVESRQWDAEGERPLSRLFHNDGGTFTDVTRASGAGLDVRGTGCVAADLDLDGATDLYVTTARDNVLLWGDGRGGFTDGGAEAGVDAYGWHSGAAVGDVNGDGWPDLFVAGYTDLNRPLPEAVKGFPNTYEGVRDLLYLNKGPGPDGRVTFREVGERLALDAARDYGLGAVFSDLDGDGDLDLYVADDTNPNQLYLNEPTPDRSGGLGFRLIEAGRRTGADDPGSGMGVASGDVDADAQVDLLVTNLGDQGHALLRNEGPPGPLRFVDETDDAGALASVLTGWGASFVDLDLDTDQDLLLANGEIPITDLEADARRMGVYGNLATSGRPGRFDDLGASTGLDDLAAINGRGLAVADFDNDGDMDAAVNVVGSRLRLLENRGTAGNWLEVGFERFSPGAVVTVRLADGRRLEREAHAGSSYLSSEDPRLHFGLGDDEAVDEVRVVWPDGTTTLKRSVRANQVLTVDEEES